MSGSGSRPSSYYYDTNSPSNPAFDVQQFVGIQIPEEQQQAGGYTSGGFASGRTRTSPGNLPPSLTAGSGGRSRQQTAPNYIPHPSRSPSSPSALNNLPPSMSYLPTTNPALGVNPSTANANNAGTMSYQLPVTMLDALPQLQTGQRGDGRGGVGRLGDMEAQTTTDLNRSSSWSRGGSVSSGGVPPPPTTQKYSGLDHQYASSSSYSPMDYYGSNTSSSQPPPPLPPSNASQLQQQQGYSYSPQPQPAQQYVSSRSHGSGHEQQMSSSSSASLNNSTSRRDQNSYAPTLQHQLSVSSSSSRSLHPLNIGSTNAKGGLPSHMGSGSNTTSPNPGYRDTAMDIPPSPNAYNQSHHQSQHHHHHSHSSYSNANLPPSRSPGSVSVSNLSPQLQNYASSNVVGNNSGVDSSGRMSVYQSSPLTAGSGGGGPEMFTSSSGGGGYVGGDHSRAMSYSPSSLYTSKSGGGGDVIMSGRISQGPTSPLHPSQQQQSAYSPTVNTPSYNSTPAVGGGGAAGGGGVSVPMGSSSRSHTQPISSGSMSNPSATAYYSGNDSNASPASDSQQDRYAGGRGPSSGSERPRGRERERGFRRVNDPRDGADLRPVVNKQPAGRRADPSGGFISPLRALTTHLSQTYHLVNPAFRYELSLNPRRVLTKPSKPAGNDGKDNDDSDYILYVNDWLGSDEGQKRYLILDILGQGTFGQVVKCQDMKTHELVAVKVIKNKPAYFNQSMMEVTLLDLLNNTWDPNDEHHILRLKDTFIHCKHLCLVFEQLSSNLYELIKQNSFRGLTTSLVRVFTAQLLDSLTVLNEARLIHCDLKPENILLKSLKSLDIKVIDFGSACHERQTVYTYIQSRFYRSPEVLLGLPYSSAIDMWSLGCICVELFLGLPLFPGTSEFNQITRIVEMLGMPPTYMLEMGKQAGQFFDSYYDEYGRKCYKLKSLEQYSKEHNVQEQPSKKYFNATTLPEIIKSYPMSRKNMKPADVEKENNNRIAFIDFVQGLLNLNPIERWSPQQARLHPFILGEPLKEPFNPHKNSGPKSPTGPQQSDAVKRPYGGLPATPQRSTGRAYPDAAAYNQHLAQQQAYTAQQNAEAYRQSQYTNPYTIRDDPQKTGHASYSGSRLQQGGAGLQPAAITVTNPSYYSVRNSASGAIAPVGPTNPPAVHHYPTRGRSNTIGRMDAVPPQLQKLGEDLVPYAGQSVTPVLHREDQQQAWERRHVPGQAGLSRRVSVNRHDAQLAFLQEQAEMGASWAGSSRAKQPTYHSSAQASPYGSYYSPPGNQQSFSVVVDGQTAYDPLGSTAPIAAPPAVYSGASSQQTRYNAPTAGTYPSSSLPNAFDPSSQFDGFDNRGEGLAQMYHQPLQPTRLAQAATTAIGHTGPATAGQYYSANNNQPQGQLRERKSQGMADIWNAR